MICCFEKCFCHAILRPISGCRFLLEFDTGSFYLERFRYSIIRFIPQKSCTANSQNGTFHCVVQTMRDATHSCFGGDMNFSRNGSILLLLHDGCLASHHVEITQATTTSHFVIFKSVAFKRLLILHRVTGCRLSTSSNVSFSLGNEHLKAVLCR